MDDLIGILLIGVLELIVIGTARLLVAAGSFGQWRGEHGNEGRIHAMAGALTFRLNGRRIVTNAGLLVLGILFYVGVIALLCWGATATVTPPP